MRRIQIYSGDAIDTSGPNFGFAALKTNATGNLTFDITLKKVKPNTKYDIWVNQYPVPHLLSEPTGEITTDPKGKGNIGVSVEHIAGTTGFWISVTNGNEIFRSAAVELN
jgi:hypothetical protein